MRRTLRAAPKLRSASTARVLVSAEPQADSALLLEPVDKREEHGEPPSSRAQQAPPELSARRRPKPTAPFFLNRGDALKSQIYLDARFLGVEIQKEVCGLFTHHHSDEGRTTYGNHSQREKRLQTIVPDLVTANHPGG